MGLYFSRNSKHFQFPPKGCFSISLPGPECNLSDYYGELLLGGQSRKETLWLTSFWDTGGSWHCPKSDSGHCHPQIHTGTSQAPGEFHQGRWGLQQRLCSLDAKQAQLEPF